MPADNTIRQARLVSPECFVIEEVEKPAPGPDEVSIAVKRCGICGSDIHAYHGRHPFMPCPLVMGHEFSGVIDEVGPGVTGLSIGERGTVEPLIVCGECYNCKSGRYNICVNRKVMGCQSPGAYAESVVVPAGKVIPLPQDMDFETGATVEPGAVAVHAVRRMGDIAGCGVVVIGAGPIGLMVAQVAKSLGAREVLIADLDPFRVSVAEQMRIDHAVCTGTHQLGDAVHALFGPNGADIWFECVGSGRALDTILELTRPGTRVSSIGIFSGQETLANLAALSEHELAVIGSSVYTVEDFEITIDLLSKGSITSSEMITHRFPLAEAQMAFQTIGKGQTSVKVMLVMESG